VKYACVVADPPWQYKGKGWLGGAKRHYETMPTAAICELRPEVADKAHLYLWTTATHIIGGDAAAVCRAWGFEPMQLLTWVKDKIGNGYYFRASTEHVMFAARGSLEPLRHDFPSHFTAKREAHSRKPDGLLWIAEQMTPGPRLEMFARRKRDGWDVFGNQAPEVGQMLLESAS
jgi:N6-adenosine-specific RNA methylase IME4